MALSKSVKIGLGIVGGLLLTTCVSCGLFTRAVSRFAEENRTAIETARAQCISPNQYRLRTGGNSALPADWQCLTPQEIAAQAEAARLAAEQARQQQAMQAERARQQQAVQAAAQRLAAEQARQQQAAQAAAQRLAAEQARQQQAAQAAAQRLAAEQAGLRWIARVRADCAEYTNGPNEIAQSAVHQRNQRYLADTPIPLLVGTLASVSTTHGGASARIRVESDGFRFSEGIDRGHPAYDQVALLTEGQCVEFSAAIEEANGIGERMEVCSFDYDARFGSIRPCAQR